MQNVSHYCCLVLDIEVKNTQTYLTIQIRNCRVISGSFFCLLLSSSHSPVDITWTPFVSFPISPFVFDIVKDLCFEAVHPSPLTSLFLHNAIEAISHLPSLVPTASTSIWSLGSPRHAFRPAASWGVALHSSIFYLHYSNINQKGKDRAQWNTYF